MLRNASDERSRAKAGTAAGKAHTAELDAGSVSESDSRAGASKTSRTEVSAESTVRAGASEGTVSRTGAKAGGDSQTGASAVSSANADIPEGAGGPVRFSPLFNDGFLWIFGSPDSAPVTLPLINAILRAVAYPKWREPGTSAPRLPSRAVSVASRRASTWSCSPTTAG